MNANQERQARALQRELDAGAARVRELKARPWWTCTGCGERFRWDEYHVCAEVEGRP